jgi:hypothetical protein
VAASGPPAAVAKDQLASDRRGRRGEGRAAPRFRAALAEDEAAPRPAAWSGAVPEPGPGDRAPRHPSGAVASLPRPAAVDRILMAAGAGGGEARVRIVSGPLAGSEIRLVAVIGQAAVQAQLLTSPAGSRETLMAAMDEVRRRLRGKGIALGGRPRHSSDRTEGGRRGEPAWRSR